MIEFALGRARRPGVMIPLLGIPFFLELPAAIDQALIAIDWLIWAAFAGDLTVRTYLAERRLGYLRTHWYDVLIVAVPFLRPLRILRSARGLRLLRLARLLPFAIRASITARTILRRHGLQYFLFIGAGIVVACAGLVTLLEQGGEGSIEDFPTALWWAVTTITIVGYGDVTPVTAAGRGVAVFLMLMGIAFFSLITASIASFLVELGGNERGTTLDDLAAEIRALRAELHLLQGIGES